MLAALDFAAYLNAIHRLESDDRLLAYTDGIVEASNASGDALGQALPSTLLLRVPNKTSTETTVWAEWQNLFALSANLTGGEDAR